MLGLQLYAIHSESILKSGLNLREVLQQHRRSLENAANAQHHHTNAKKIQGALSELERCQMYLEQIGAGKTVPK
jgi:hypothetical protein